MNHSHGESFDVRGGGFHALVHGRSRHLADAAAAEVQSSARVCRRREEKRSPVGRLDFKSSKGRQTILGGFDSHSLPPDLRACDRRGVRTVPSSDGELSISLRSRAQRSAPAHAGI